MEALNTTQPRAEIIIERKQKRATGSMGAVDEPEAVTAIRIVDYQVTTVICVGAGNDRQQGGTIDGPRGAEAFRRLNKDDNGG